MTKSKRCITHERLKQPADPYCAECYGNAKQAGHTPTPQLYAAITPETGELTIRIDDKTGRVVSVIGLSGYKVGHEKSPRDWQDFIVRACNSHDALMEAGKAVIKSWEKGDLAGAVRMLSDALDSAK